MKVELTKEQLFLIDMSLYLNSRRLTGVILTSSQERAKWAWKERDAIYEISEYLQKFLYDGSGRPKRK